jgi:hypothetical protein
MEPSEYKEVGAVLPLPEDPFELAHFLQTRTNDEIKLAQEASFKKLRAARDPLQVSWRLVDCLAEYGLFAKLLKMVQLLDPSDKDDQKTLVNIMAKLHYLFPKQQLAKVRYEKSQDDLSNLPFDEKIRRLDNIREQMVQAEEKRRFAEARILEMSGMKEVESG